MTIEATSLDEQLQENENYQLINHGAIIVTILFDPKFRAQELTGTSPLRAIMGANIFRNQSSPGKFTHMITIDVESPLNWALEKIGRGPQSVTLTPKASALSFEIEGIEPDGQQALFRSPKH